ncbi:MAG: MBL fold metallo-hydrolase [Bacteroidales bacterium]|nr:MBL fold metallo-hydrolase [Bacteroidales bacterium]
MKIIVFIPFFLLANIIFSPSYGQNQIDVTYIANSGFLIESNGKQVLIDALFENGWDSYLTPADSIVSDIIKQQDPFNNSTLMLITHNHGDHFNSSMVVAYLKSNSENTLIAPSKVTNEILKHPDYKKVENQIVQLDKINQEKNDTTIEGIRVRSFFIQHDSRPQIENVGFLINIDNLKVFHTGDYNGSEIIEFEKLQLKNKNIDLALLNFYGFWNTTAEREFTEKYINPKKIVLMHIPPAETGIVKNSVNQITDFIDIAVFESSMEKKSFIHFKTSNDFGL